MKKQFQNIDVQAIKAKFALKIYITNTKAQSEIKKSTLQIFPKRNCLAYGRLYTSIFHAYS